jgi:hypothetical protein
MTKTLLFYSDPSHGWLRVLRSDVIAMGLAPLISPYSYVSDCGLYLYLEEDRDASLYYKALDRDGVEYHLEDKVSNKPSFIRKLKSYAK